MKRRFAPILAAWLILISISSSQGEGLLNESVLIVSGSSVNVREKPGVSGKELAKVSLGDSLPILGQTSNPEKIGSLTSVWYKIRLGTGREGWVFGGFGRPADAAAQFSVLMDIIQTRLDCGTLSSAERLELLKCVQDNIGKAPDENSKATMELLKWLSLQKAIDRLAQDRRSADSETSLKPFLNDLFFYEPAGQYLVDVALIWKLHDSARGLPVADRIAWEAANHPLAGETEGFLPAVFARINLRLGKYLALHPDGAFVDKAMEGLQEYLQNPFAENEPLGAEEASILRDETRTLKTRLESVSHPKKAKILDRIAHFESLIPETKGKK